MLTDQELAELGQAVPEMDPACALAQLLAEVRRSRQQLRIARDALVQIGAWHCACGCATKALADLEAVP